MQKTKKGKKYENTNVKEPGLTILISEKVGFQRSNIMKDIA